MRSTHSGPVGKRISSIGLGCVTFGREIDQAASFAFADRAQERGVTFFDTAVAYGAGASETILGAWQAARRPASESIVMRDQTSSAVHSGKNQRDRGPKPETSRPLLDRSAVSSSVGRNV